MAYLPPMNGGRLNASIVGANTAGALAALSTGTMYFSGGNNVTLSQNGSTIAVSGPNVHNVIIGGNTAGATATVSTGNLYFAGGNNIVLSQNANSITISGAAAGAAGSNAFGISSTFGNNSGNTGLIAGSSLQYVFAGGNNVTLNQSITSNSATLSISGLSFSNANNVNFGIVGGTLTASASYSQQQMFDAGISNLGNFAGLTGVSNTNGLILVGSNNVTLSQTTNANGAVVSINGPVFSNSNNVVFGTNGSVVTASVAVAGGGVALAGGGVTISSGTAALNAAGGISLNGAGSNLTFSAPPVSSLVAGNDISLSAAGSAITIAHIDPIGSYYDNLIQGMGSATSGVGNQAIAYAPLATQTGAANRLLIQPLDPANDHFPFNMAFGTMLMNFSNVVTTNQSAAHSSTYYFGLYTRVNSTQLSLVNSVSSSMSLAANINNFSSYMGARWLTIHSSQFSSPPIMSAGMRYYFAWMARTGLASYSGHSIGGLFYGQSAMRSGLMGQAGVSTNTSLYAWHPFMGVHSNTTISAMPVSIANSEINKATAMANFIPHIVFNAGGGQLY